MDNSQSKQIYTLSLSHDGSPAVPRGYVYLPPPTDPPYVLRFVVDGSAPICQDGKLWVKMPLDGTEETDMRDEKREKQRWKTFK